MKKAPNLGLLDPGDPQQGFNVIIETPRGSPNKYAYDTALGAFRLKTVLPVGAVFPYDFGFLPDTLAADGDQLDVLVLLDAVVPMGCIVPTRLIGVIEAKQTEKKGKTLRNDRLLGVALHARTHAHVKTLADLRPHLLDEIEAFFVFYNRAHGKVFTPLGRKGPKVAERLFRAARRRGAPS
jgi:inorganic pyrophosphatase